MALSLMMDHTDVAESSGDGEYRRRPVIVDDYLDVEEYAGLYTGRTKISRLLFIADQTNDHDTRLEALKIAYDEVKKMDNASLFKQVVSKIDGVLGPDYAMDSTWLENVERMFEAKKNRLDHLLNVFKAIMIDESIRLQYKDMGDFHYSHGELEDALRYYFRVAEYCSQREHIIQICLSLILVYIQMGQAGEVLPVVRRTEKIQPWFKDDLTLAKVACAGGVADIEIKSYVYAAQEFLDVTPDLEDNYTDVIASQDVATYGGLCALAFFDLAKLKQTVIDSVNMKHFFEFSPQVRDLVSDFYSSDFDSCLQHMRNLKPKLLLDIHLHDHVETLYSNIRKKALVKYTHPFMSIDLHRMANTFRTNASALEKELESLIIDNKLEGGVIDSENKVLYLRRNPDERKTVYHSTLRNVTQFERDFRVLLMGAKGIMNESEILDFDAMEDLPLD